MARVEVRQLRTGEEAQAAILIRASGPEVFDPVLGPEANMTVRSLTGLLVRGGALFSRENTLVALDGDQLVGAAVGYPALVERSEGLAFLRHTLTGVGPLLWLRRVLVQLAMAAITRGVRKDALYLASIAVQGDRRGARIGERLLEVMGDTARGRGLAGIEADVTLDNDRALRFYERIGFTTLARRPARFLRPLLGFPGYRRIRLEL